MEVTSGIKTSTTALAAVAAASSGAAAADVSFKAPPDPVVNWDGYYLGASLGASWLHSMQDPSGIALLENGNRSRGSTTGGTSATASAAGWLGGIQVGRNWQHKNFVFGAEADFSWIGSNNASSSNNMFFAPTGYTSYNTPTSSSSRVNALSTFRARFGFDFNGTMPYLTGGFALGHMRNVFSLTGYNGFGGGTQTGTITQSSWVPGVVLGGGIEHQLTPNWTLRGEVLWVGFQSKSVANPYPATGLFYQSAVNGGGAARFSNDLTIAKIGLNYRF
jgi:outer membrane immunogenic protein